MGISQEIADGLTEIETDFPATFIWNSTSYKAIAGSESRAVSAGDFGLENVDSLTLIVQLGQFGAGSKPEERNVIIFNSRSYRIEVIEKAPQDAFVVYRCVRDQRS
tara:strand:+ start:240 stop:557 length:318 start_codon:yes stop_codon:yes gene_type:complete